MSLTLSQMLALAGHLDDSPGFDTPRERWRRFLTEHITDVRLARALVEECQHAVGEQSHRALQDLIVMLGRFLGFETAFGAYTKPEGAARHDGHWRSRRRLHLMLEIRTDRTSARDLEDLTGSILTSEGSAHVDPEARRIGVCVLTSRYAGRTLLSASLDADKARHLRIVSVHSLLWLADLVDAGRLEHEEILQLLGSGFDLDLVVDLIDRCVSAGPPTAAGEKHGSESLPPATL